ncbi:MAG: Hsp20/alpha crystallin family protein [Candidatus Polarisedimenticolaceae bacterium]|nr:Hsp20/alpha crystallin family protein [Candidatus Polarisedimenticolaceae bacterium]
MTERKEIEQQEPKAVQQTQQGEHIMWPQVDICEDATDITLQADMPGVPKDRLDIQVDKDTLSIAGEACLDTPDDMEALHVDISVTRYQRSFSLGGELDTTKIEAGLKDGLLTLHIPKREEHKPRKIEVRTG